MAKNIYGLIAPYLQVKTMYQKLKHAKPGVVLKVPQDIVDKYKRLILCCDLVHINGFVFLNTVSWVIIFDTVSLINNMTINTIESRMKQVNNIYLQHGLKITRLHSDGEFKPLRPKVVMLGIDLTTASKRGHVPEIEQFVHVVKEWVRSSR